jgi:Terminase large subunit, T4likevirus-type, N-terminal
LLPKETKDQLLQEAQTQASLDPDGFEAFLHWYWPLWARPEQIEPEGDWTYWLILAGRGYGKTRAGCEWVRKHATSGRYRYVNLIGATADDARDILVEGESGILNICPDWQRPDYQPTKRRLDWPNGCRSLIFTADEPERLRGKQHEALLCDEIAHWRYSESWDQAMLGLRIGPDPRACITTTPKPKAILRELLERPRLVITRGTTYENRENLAPQFYDEIIRKYEGTRLGQQELEAELLLDEGLAFRLRDGVHVVPPFFIPEHWERFESMDYGRNHPTAWPVFAVDHDGNIVCFDMYYSPGLVSEHAAAVKANRRRWWPGDHYPVCYGPPDIRSKYGFIDPRGREISVETEFADHGISFVTAQTDRRAGYLRIEELLRPREERLFPEWHPLSGQSGAPQLYFFDIPSLQPMIDQVRDAPLEDPASPISRFPGEAIEQAWESEHGHSVASLRYGMMSRPSPTGPLPERGLDDERAEALRQSYLRERREEEERDGDLELAGLIDFPDWLV